MTTQHREFERPKPDRGLWAWRIACLAALFLALVFTFGARVFSGEGMILVDGRRLATLASPGTAKTAVAEFKASLADEYGKAVGLSADIKVKRASRPADEIVPTQEAKKLLGQAVHPVRKLAVVYIDGEPALALDSFADARETLKLYAQRFAGDRKLTEPPKFKESVEIKTEECDPSLRVESPQAGAEALSAQASQAEPVYYAVRKNQTASTIAHANGMGLNELKSLNPGVNLDKLKIGQKLVIKKGQKKGRLTVITTSREILTVPLDCPVEVVKSPDVYWGKTFIKQQGRFGEKRITAFITRENGEQATLAEVASTVLSQPRPEVILVGTKPRPRPVAFTENTATAVASSSGGWGERMARNIYLQYRKGNSRGTFRGVYGVKELGVDVGTAHSLNHAFGVHYARNVEWGTIISCLEKGDHSIGGRWGCAGGPHNPQAAAAWIKKNILKR
jgi:LysM repeat protein